jgi:hypothetical protein
LLGEQIGPEGVEPSQPCGRRILLTNYGFHRRS